MAWGRSREGETAFQAEAPLSKDGRWDCAWSAQRTGSPASLEQDMPGGAEAGRWAGPQFMGALDFHVGAPHRGGREPGEASTP